MVPFDVALFKAPNFSVFDMSHDNKLNMGLGDLVPVNWRILHPHERFTAEVGNLVRMQPLNGAILQHYDITFDTFFVPMRLIFGKEKSERFFNLFEAGNNGFQHGGTIPQLSWRALYALSKPGNLLDYLGYPTFKNVRSYVSAIANSATWNITAIADSAEDSPDSISVDVSEQSENLMSWPVFSMGVNGMYYVPRYLAPSTYMERSTLKYTGTLGVNYADKVYTITWTADSVPDSYFIYLCKKAGILLNAPSSAGGLVFVFDKAYTLDDLLLKLSVSPEKSVEMYFDYLQEFFGSNTQVDSQAGNLLEGFVRDLVNAGKENAPSILPIFAYWRIVSDWYMNYNLSNMPYYELYDYLLTRSLDPDDDLYDTSQILSSLGDDFDYGYESDIWGFFGAYLEGAPSGGMKDCFKRNWANDYFTSAFRSPQSGTAVPIPQNGNIPDLRRSNVLQEMLERVMYAGRRYRDQVRAFFSVVPENSRLDVVEVLSREVQPLQISEVTQTNQGDLNKLLETPFGSFGGQSQTVGSHKLVDYTADEHGVIMTLASIRPKAAYMQGVRRELMATDVYDFLWPQFEQIGEQEVYMAELFADFDPDLQGFVPDDTFGYQRRYGHLMYQSSEVHGDLLNSLSYLHSARDFVHRPELNVGFGEIRVEDDDLNRVFVYSADERPFIVELFFDSKMIRPLSRYIHYDL